jgi:hypothetical protein
MGYTPEFWDYANALANDALKQCEQCYVTNGEDITQAKHPKRKTRAVVRVALRVPGVIDPSNLGLFCTRCRRGKYQVKKRDTATIPMFPKENHAEV